MVKEQILTKVKELKLTDRVKELQSRLQKWKAYLPSTKTTKGEGNPQ
jgi:hypothetical protein